MKHSTGHRLSRNAACLSLCLIFFCLAFTIQIAESSQCSSQCGLYAECREFGNDGHCCECTAGYSGNGAHCFEKDDSIVIRGKVFGYINGVNIGEQELHAFVHTLSTDARNYVAMGRIPTSIGPKIGLLLPISIPIHWLFAGENSNTLNGFSLTGGVFARESDSLYFDENGNQVGNLFLTQNSTGLYENGKELHLESYIDAKLPTLSDTQQVIYLDYNQKFDYKSNVEQPLVKKVVESKSSIYYMVATNNDASNMAKYRIEHSEKIHFDVCHGLMRERLEIDTPFVELMTKRLFVTYSQSEHQVRFTSANFLRASESSEVNPCDRNMCGVFSECIVDPSADNGYYCLCKPGFDGENFNCTDLNECEEGSSYCATTASCKNTLGAFECTCNPPYVGDGRSCELKESNDESVSGVSGGGGEEDVCAKCSADARCFNDAAGNPYCLCNPGFNGNGYQCAAEDSKEEVSDETQPPQVVAEETTTKTLIKNEVVEMKRSCEDCHQNAACELQESTGGECCVCSEGFFGNGKFCYEDSNSIFVNGKVSGMLNNVKLEDVTLYASVLTHTADSRNFMGVGKVPESIGASFQLLIHLVTPINWLFGGRNGLDESVKVRNGFSITGGLFSRRLEVEFRGMDRVYQAQIKQEYLGLDPQSKESLVVKTEINGELPVLDPDAHIFFKDYNQVYTKNEKGRVWTQGELNYEITSVDDSQSFKSYSVYYIDNLEFGECEYLDEAQWHPETRVASKKAYVKYQKSDGWVRFSSSNFIYPNNVVDDPCDYNTCSIYSECVADYDSPNNYTCICKGGFEGDNSNCYDMDECALGIADCSPNAKCYNLVGSFDCLCMSPYKGNGKVCSLDECEQCDANARCEQADGMKRCVCNEGWKGNGYECNKDASKCDCHENAQCIPNLNTNSKECRCNPGFIGTGFDCKPLACNEFSNCDENAKCVMNKFGNFVCECSDGYAGNGYKCDTQTCDVLNNCDENAQCLPDVVTLQFKCVCKSGYEGNGYQCQKDIRCDNMKKKCQENAECLFDEDSAGHICKCKPGYSGDGYKCSLINSCRENSGVCDSNANCVFDTSTNDFVCKCNPGFEGNGLRDKCFVDESYGKFLVYAQGPSLHKIALKPSDEELSSSPDKNRIVHIPGQTAVGISYDCHEELIYWSDVTTNTINKIRLDGSNFTIVLQDVKSAEGLAVDWLSRNIYFTDSETKTIEVASLNGNYRKVLVNTHLSNPRGVALDPIDGYIFWTDWNRKHPKIERANMDGSHRKVIVSTEIGVPNGLYFDQKRQEICWGDAKTKRIECVGKDGQNRRIVTQLDQIYPFDLTEVRTNIYWSDWTRKEIPVVDKDGVLGQPIKLSIGGNGRVYGIVAVKNACPRGTNACSRTNGDCAQLCLPRPDHGRQCVCSDNAANECSSKVKKH